MRSEVVVSRWLARAEGIGAGDTLDVRSGPGSASTAYQVVGFVDGPDIAGASEVVGLPGALLPPSGRGWPQSDVEVSWQAIGPAPLPWDSVLGLNRLGVTALSRAVIADPPPPDGVPYMQSERSGATLQEALFAAVTIGLMLLQVALLAGPAIAVGARRNQHTLALLAASGADRRHLRAVVLGSAGVVGLVGCTAAAAAGIALARLGMIALERVGTLELPRHPPAPARPHRARRGGHADRTRRRGFSPRGGRPAST